MKKLFQTKLPKSGRMMTAVLVGALVSLSPEQSLQAAQPANEAVADISRYCQTCWRNARLDPESWSDCTQEVLLRLLERVDVSKWGDILKNEDENRKEFFRAIDAVKKRQQRSKKYSSYIDECADSRSHLDEERNELREALELAANKVLSARQSRILQLTCAGSSIPEIAKELGTTVERISDEKHKAIRKLQKHFGSGDETV